MGGVADRRMERGRSKGRLADLPWKGLEMVWEKIASLALHLVIAYSLQVRGKTVAGAGAWSEGVPLG